MPTPTTIDILTPSLYANPAELHARYAQLRRESPVAWMDHPAYRPFWAVTRHADILNISQNNELFINAPRLTLIPKAAEEYQAKIGMGRQTSVRTIIDMDEPEHRKYRAVTQNWFLGKGVARLQGSIETIARRYVDVIAEKGGQVDFAQDIANWVPLNVIMRIIGLPEEDSAFILRCTQAILAASDPDLQRDQQLYGTAEFQELFKYLNGFVERWRREPTEDLGSVIANGLVDGAPMGLLETLSYLMIASTAGHETTSSAMGGALLALIEQPAAMAALRADPALWETAADEVVRFVSPVRHFLRTATADTAVGDVPIRAGESVCMFYLSANRDETVFDAPFEFRPGRTPNRHLGFGTGAHYCLGRLLALAELRALFRELLSRTADIALDGEPQWTESNFVGSLKHLPVRIRMN
jgi:cytochrome P450